MLSSHHCECVLQGICVRAYMYVHSSHQVPKQETKTSVNNIGNLTSHQLIYRYTEHQHQHPQQWQHQHCIGIHCDT